MCVYVCVCVCVHTCVHVRAGVSLDIHSFITYVLYKTITQFRTERLSQYLHAACYIAAY